MKRMTLVIPSLTSGGAERVMTTLANAWAEQDRAVTILSFDNGRELPFYPLDSRIEHRPLSLAGVSPNPVQAILNNAGRILKLRSAIRESRPEMVLSFLDTTNVTTLIATRGLRIPVVVEEHTDPAAKRLGSGWVFLRHLTYPRASRVVVLSDQSASYFPASVQRRLSIIPNPIVVEAAKPERTTATNGKTALALGRLGPEKGFDLLIDAFAKIANDLSDWNLVIWGEGALRTELEDRIGRWGLRDRISLPGRTQQPHVEMRRADLFVMSSRREGFPMALGEAMACGLPALSTDCPSGPRQIIRNGIDGVLVEPENTDALANGMRDLMSSDLRRQQLAIRAPEVLDRFGIQSVLGQWDELFNSLLQSAGKTQSRQIRTNGPAQTGTADGTGD